MGEKGVQYILLPYFNFNYYLTYTNNHVLFISLKTLREEMKDRMMSKIVCDKKILLKNINYYFPQVN